jgi:hypothetical protein
MNQSSPAGELDQLPLYAPAEVIADHVTRTRFPVSSKTVSTHWRRAGLQVVTIQGRAVARFAEALAIADEKIAKARPSSTMRGGHDPAKLQGIKRKRAAAQAAAGEA